MNRARDKAREAWLDNTRLPVPIATAGAEPTLRIAPAMEADSLTRPFVSFVRECGPLWTVLPEGAENTLDERARSYSRMTRAPADGQLPFGG